MVPKAAGGSWPMAPHPNLLMPRSQIWCFYPKLHNRLANGALPWYVQSFKKFTIGIQQRCKKLGDAL